MKVVMEFEQGDLECIVNTPKSPCSTCTSHDYSCIGCPKQINWEKDYGRELQRRNLEDAAQKYWNYIAAIEAERRAKEQVEKQRQALIQSGLEGLLKFEADACGTQVPHTNSFG